VDRIGQRRRVHATLLISHHPTELVVLSALARRALAANRSFGASVLDDFTPPGMLAMAAAILGQAPLPSAIRSSTQRLPALCTAWQRRARAMTRHIGGKRQLARHWRGPSAPRGRPVLVSGPVLKALRLHGGALFVFSIAVLDRSGDVVERRLVPLRVPHATPVLTRGITAALERAAEASVAGRLRRVRRLAASAAARRITTERAIALHLHTLRRPEEAQMGMFSQREARLFDLARATAALAAEDATTRIQLEQDGKELSLDRPALEWVWWPQ
jgi:hypothetical protein